MQNSRYEFKYLIDEHQAGRIRGFLGNHIVPDPHADPQSHNGYAVHSLYLDSPSLTLLRASLEGLRNRFKLRIRFYDADPQQPVFLEIKRRIDGVITKQRTRVDREGLACWLARHRLEQAKPVDRGTEAGASFHDFCSHCRQLAAQGIVYVSYHREAYVGARGEPIRVTLDRHVATERYQIGAALAPPRHPRRVSVPGVILEIKFSNRFPLWLQNLVRAFDLTRVSLAKYVKSVQELEVRASAWH